MSLFSALCFWGFLQGRHGNGRLTQKAEHSWVLLLSPTARLAHSTPPDLREEARKAGLVLFLQARELGLREVKRLA